MKVQRDADVISLLESFVGQAKAVNIMKRAAEEIRSLRALDAKRQDEWIALYKKSSSDSKLLQDEVNEAWSVTCRLLMAVVDQDEEEILRCAAEAARSPMGKTLKTRSARKEKCLN